jgi:hypothetical protein
MTPGVGCDPLPTPRPPGLRRHPRAPPASGTPLPLPDPLHTHPPPLDKTPHVRSPHAQPTHPLTATATTHRLPTDDDHLDLVRTEHAGLLVLPKPGHVAAPVLGLRCNMPTGHDTLRHEAISRSDESMTFVVIWTKTDDKLDADEDDH